MSDRTAVSNRVSRNEGFTLIELLIVVSMIGLLSVTLAGVFSVFARTTPDASQRVTDARSLKGLVTWIPQDMDATPPGGFDADHAAWPCAGAAPLNSYNVIAMSWEEKGDITTSFDASYRYELRGTDWVIARYSCENSGSPIRVNMTSALPAWNSSSPPAWVELCNTAIDAATGTCPQLSGADDPGTPDVDESAVLSMKVTVTLFDGSRYTIDAAAKNPDENLADDPNAVTNYPPIAAAPNLALTMIAGETKVLDLYATHQISDPEGNFLTSAVDSYEPMPSGISVRSADPLTVTIEADPSLLPGTLTPVSLVVSDAYGGSVDVTITIKIDPPPNVAPVAATASYTLTIGVGESLVLPLDVSHGISDPNGDVLTLAVSSWPAPLANKPEVGAPLGQLQMKVTVKPGALPELVGDPIETVVSDGRGGTVTVLTYINIVPASGNTPPVVTPFPNPAASIQAGASAALTVVASDPDLDLIWATVDPAGSVPAGLTVTTSGLNVSVAADGSIAPGSYVVPLLVRDWFGASKSVSATIQILPPPPPPPSPCVLGGLTLSQSTVGRTGTGQGPRPLDRDVLVTLTYSGTCDGLVLKYDTGHPSGLGSGVGRVFPSGSPTTVQLRGDASGGSEKWTDGGHLLTVSTTSAVSPNSTSITLTVN